MGITNATPSTTTAALGTPPVKARGRQKASTPSTDEKRERILQAAEALFDRQGYDIRSQMFHDLRADVYNTTRMTNWTRPWNFSAPDPGADFYTTDNLRKSGKR